MHRTCLLDLDAWDWVLDVNGDLAIASGAYAVAQDVASRLGCVQGECITDAAAGLALFDLVTATPPPTQFIGALMEEQAMSVPGVSSAQAQDVQISGGVLSGRVIITTDDDTTLSVSV